MKYLISHLSFVALVATVLFAAPFVQVQAFGFGFNVNCFGNPSSAGTGNSVLWTAYAVGGFSEGSAVTYTWSGTDGLSGSGSSISKVYTTTGTKIASVTGREGSLVSTGNCAVTVYQSSEPDLTVGAVSPQFATAGQSVTFIANIENAGTGTAGGSVARFQRATSASGANATSLGTVSVSSISAGASRNIAKSYTFPSGGTWYVRACADVSGSVAESDESNNCSAWRGITVASASAECPYTSGVWYSGGTNTLLAYEMGASTLDCKSLAQSAGYDYWNRQMVDRNYGCPSTGACQYDPITTYCYGVTNPSGTQSKPSYVSSGDYYWFDSGETCPPISPPTVTLTANPEAILYGDASELSWISDNADSCTGTNFSTGGAVTGVRSVSPTTDTTYAVTCTNSGGSRTSSATVSVLNEYFSASCVASPESVDTGDQVTWSATQSCGVASCSLSEGVSDTPFIASDCTQQQIGPSGCDYGFYYRGLCDYTPCSSNSSYVWSGSDGLNGSNSSVTKTYTSAGNKTAIVTITFNGQTQEIMCENTVSVVDTTPQCSDSIDNDGDGTTDYPNDLGCSSANDTTESPNPQCSDGIDNDGDGRTDLADYGCTNGSDTTESPNPQCSDSIDNDGDGRIDTADYGCTGGAGDTSEAPNPQCSDGIDNDGNGQADYPGDIGCTSYTDGNEYTPPVEATIDFTVSPGLVRSGDSVTLMWSATDVSSCTVAGSNGDTWSGTSGNEISSAITVETTFVIACEETDGDSVSETEVVKLVPSFEEVFRTLPSNLAGVFRSLF